MCYCVHACLCFYFTSTVSQFALFSFFPTNSYFSLHHFGFMNEKKKKKTKRPTTTVMTTTGFIKFAKFTANLIEYCFMITNKMIHFVAVDMSLFLNAAIQISVRLINYCALNTYIVQFISSQICFCQYLLLLLLLRQFRGRRLIWVCNQQKWDLHR